MHHKVFRLPAVVPLALLLFLGGCFNLGKSERQPLSFYSLSHLPQPGTEARAASMEGRSTLAIGPVQFPEYLNQPQITTRTGDHKLQLDEFHRWAEPLKDNFERTVKGNLSALVPSDRFMIAPWRAVSEINYQLALDVIRFDGELGGDASLIATWAILGDGEEVLVAKRSIFQEATGGNDHESLVEAMSKTVEDLSREIAAALTEML